MSNDSESKCIKAPSRVERAVGGGQEAEESRTVTLRKGECTFPSQMHMLWDKCEIPLSFVLVWFILRGHDGETAVG